MVLYDLKWSEAVKGKLCSATKLLNKVSALVTWSSTDFVGINWCNWGVLLVAVTAFLCKLVSECLLISYSPPEATLKLELHRVQNARSFHNELDHPVVWFFSLVLEFTIVFLFLWCRRRSTRSWIPPSLCWLRHRYKMPETNLI